VIQFEIYLLFRDMKRIIAIVELLRGFFFALRMSERYVMYTLIEKHETIFNMTKMRRIFCFHFPIDFSMHFTKLINPHWSFPSCIDNI
jgi:hypothetical protein